MLTVASTAGASTPPTCAVADVPTPLNSYDDYPYTLLDTAFALPPEYEPPDLVRVSQAFPASYDGGGELLVRSVMIADLSALLREAEMAGVRFAVQSAYRSYAYQERTFLYWVERDGYEAAIASSARPGHSEHQLGTAIDMRSLDGPPAWDLEDWALTPEGAWLEENAYRFGFVMSYPRGSADVTCYVYEPWHYRYVGRELAADVRASGVTPREYMWRLHEAMAGIPTGEEGAE